MLLRGAPALAPKALCNTVCTVAHCDREKNVSCSSKNELGKGGAAYLGLLLAPLQYCCRVGTGAGRSPSKQGLNTINRESI